MINFLNHLWKNYKTAIFSFINVIVVFSVSQGYITNDVALAIS